MARGSCDLSAEGLQLPCLSRESVFIGASARPKKTPTSSTAPSTESSPSPGDLRVWEAFRLCDRELAIQLLFCAGRGGFSRIASGPWCRDVDVLNRMTCDRLAAGFEALRNIGAGLVKMRREKSN